MRTIHRPTSPFRRRHWVGWLNTPVLLLCCIFVSIGVWLLHPPTQEPGAADVVVVLAGKNDGRHELGAHLTQTGVAENLVVSNPRGLDDEEGSSLCRGARQPNNIDTYCLDPQPVTTAGEAMTLDRLAAETNWRSAVIVTNRPHNYRVRTIFNECTDLDITVVSVDWVEPERVLYHVSREIGGFIKHWWTDPCKGVS